MERPEHLRDVERPSRRCEADDYPATEQLLDVAHLRARLVDLGQYAPRALDKRRARARSPAPGDSYDRPTAHQAHPRAFAPAAIGRTGRRLRARPRE